MYSVRTETAVNDDNEVLMRCAREFVVRCSLMLPRLFRLLAAVRDGLLSTET